MHVVVVAYGPRAVTRRAVGRVRGWGSVASTISVVAASPAWDGLPRSFDAVRVSSTEGTAGVRQLAGRDPVLVVHDDVRLDAAGARTLIAGLEDAEIVVAADRSSTPGFACFAARSLEPIDTSIVIPGARLALDTVTSLDVSAKHDHSCRAQLAEDRLDPSEPLLVASMIVRNEEERLPDALASVRGLVDRIDICDTGSTDTTMDVVRRYGGRLREIEWRNDFGWARNQALEMCRDATYALMFDADERITVADPASARRWLRTWSHEFDAVSMAVMNERDDGVGSTSNSIRITRPALSSFDGAVHEVLTSTQPNGRPGRIVADTGMSVIHLGYRNEIIEARGKHQRNIDIARAAHETTPSAKTAIDLARSLLAAGDHGAEATALLELASTQLDSNTAPAGHSFVLASRAQQEYRNGNPDAAVELARQALDFTPNEDLALITAATALLDLDRPNDLIAIAHDVAERSDGAPLFAVARNVTRYRAMVGLAHIRAARFDTGIDVLSEVMIEDAAGVADIVAAAVPPIVEAATDVSRLTPLVAHDATGQVTRALASQIPPATLSSICLAGLMLGPAPHPVVAMQLTAALVSGLDDLTEAGLEFADDLDHQTRSKLAALATRKQLPGIASRLAEPVAAKTGDRP